MIYILHEKDDTAMNFETKYAAEKEHTLMIVPIWCHI